MATAKLIKKGESKYGKWYQLIKEVTIEGWIVSKTAFVVGVPNDPEIDTVVNIPDAVDKLIKWE